MKLQQWNCCSVADLFDEKESPGTHFMAEEIEADDRVLKNLGIMV